MLSSIFTSILTDGTFTGAELGMVTIASLVCGLIIAISYSIKNKCSRSFAVTLVLLPAIVELVIILVNGNIGAGVAVAGAFSLVRFRSAPGRGQEITSIFLAMAVGLATGMGYIGIAAIFAAIITIANLILSNVSFGNGANEEKTLKITVPEGLDFEGIFDDIFERYTTKADLVEVKTSGMGSLYKLNYSVVLRSKASTKGMIDEMRQRNGNLEISCSRPVAVKSEEL
jgi:hypothetical protein